MTLDYAGLTASNAYIRIEHFTINKFETPSPVTARCYARKPVEGTPAFKDLVFTFTYDLNGENIYKQAYLAAKKLPEFAHAEDC